MIVEYNGHIIAMLLVSHEASLILILDPLYNRNFPFLSTVLKSSEVESGTLNYTISIPRNFPISSTSG